MPVRAEQVAKATQRDIFLSQCILYYCTLNVQSGWSSEVDDAFLPIWIIVHLMYSQDGHQKWMMRFCQFGIIELNCQLKQVTCCWVYIPVVIPEKLQQ